MIKCSLFKCFDNWFHSKFSGLVVQYKEDEDFRHFCGMLDGLAFLPLEHVAEGMAHLRRIVPPGAEGVIEYFDSTYVTGTYRNIRVPNGNELYRRVPPMFLPVSWNVNQATLNNDPRTNNIAEAGNKRFSEIIGHNHPNIWKCIDYFRQEEKVFCVTVAQNEAGVSPRRRVRRETVQHQTRLQNLCTQFDSGEKYLNQFLRGIGHNIRHENF